MTDTHDAQQEQDQQGQHQYHPSTGEYWQIAAILAVLTAVEIGLYYAGQAGMAASVTIPGLIILTILKFVLVVLWFMHLRFDRPVLNRLFIIGLIFAGVLYGIVALITLT